MRSSVAKMPRSCHALMRGLPVNLEKGLEGAWDEVKRRRPGAGAVPQRSGNGSPAGPFCGSAGTHTLSKARRAWPRVRNSHRRTTRSISGASAGIRCPARNRGSVRSLRTFFSRSLSRSSSAAAARLNLTKRWRTSEGGTERDRSARSVQSRPRRESITLGELR